MSDEPVRTKLAVVFSDIHCGSIFGLCPPEFPLSEGAVARITPFQQWLWEQWQDFEQFCFRIVGDDPYTLIANGDMVEGEHHQTKQLIHPDSGMHGDIAKAVIKPLADKAEHVLFVKGTRAHVGTVSEDHIASAQGAEPDPFNKGAAWWRLRLRIHGCLCRASHHISATIRQSLEATQLSIQLAEERLAALRQRREVPKVFVRSHRHTFGQYSDGDGLFLVTSAWQGSSEFVHKILPTAELAIVGGFVLDWRNVDPGELPAIHPFRRVQPAMQEFEA